jgi:hypothetical protein
MNMQRYPIYPRHAWPGLSSDSRNAAVPHTLGLRLVIESYKYFKNNFPMDSMLTVACYVRMYQYLVQAQTEDLIEMDEFRLLCTVR